MPSGSMPCAQKTCPYKHSDSTRGHGHCCNACKSFNKNPEKCNDWKHTVNCSGAGQWLQRTYPQAEQRWDTPDLGPERPLVRTFEVPGTWLRGDQTIRDHIRWYAERYDVHLDDTTLRNWGYLDECAKDAQRELTLCAYAEDNLPWLPSGSIINVARSLNGQSNKYRMQDVTGVNFCVQAVVAAQQNTPILLLHAVYHIECTKDIEFAFACSHGTHRSVALAFLLKTLVYPNATILLTTRRTQLAAERAGCAYADLLDVAGFA